MGGPLAQSKSSAPGYRLLGAILVNPGGNIFLKFTGPAKTIAANQRWEVRAIAAIVRQAISRAATLSAIEKLCQGGPEVWVSVRTRRSGPRPGSTPDVVVNQHVAHPTDSLPLQRRKAAARLGRNALARLANHFNVPDDGVLHILGGYERFSAGPDETGDAVAAFQHVVKVQAVVLHKGVASARILSRTYQCSDLSVPTWTVTPSNS